MVTRTERGWAAHFVSSQDCLFRRNTLVEGKWSTGELRVVVSTIGNYIPNPKLPYPERIQPLDSNNSQFETRAFVAELEGLYWEADVTKEIPLESRCRIPLLCTDDRLADQMHELCVEEVVEKLKQFDPEVVLSRLRASDGVYA